MTWLPGNGGLASGFYGTAMGTRCAVQTTFAAMHRVFAMSGLSVALVLGAAACGDRDEATDGLTLSAAWARPTPGSATAGAVYLIVESEADDTILSASVPADIAARAQLHQTAPAGQANGTPDAEGGMEHEGEMMMTMQEFARVDLVAGQPFSFAPGAAHIMILDLAAPLTLGQEFTLELQLESGSSVPVDVVVADTAPTE